VTLRFIHKLLGEQAIVLPHSLTIETMQALVSQVINDEGTVQHSRIRLNFSRLTFIDPAGVVVLCNLIDYLRELGVKVNVDVNKPYSQGLQYLDDFGFFDYYNGKSLRPQAALRRSTVPIERVQGNRLFSYLDTQLMPWIAERVGLSQDSVSTVKTCIEEIFHNVTDHSGVQIGSAFAQFYPNKEQIHVAISDYGVGIPTVVRRKVPDISDSQALTMACEEGFTTKENVRNRGAGLPTLISYVTMRNKGSVLIASGKAELAATSQNGLPKIRARRIRDGFYPGTLVRVILRTDTFEAMAEDIQPEAFNW
jgi:anti-sigma regulatory factor (Ser/Thr protein kinase)/ABC-type transporter Mla MlaB component